VTESDESGQASKTEEAEDREANIQPVRDSRRQSAAVEEDDDQHLKEYADESFN